MHAEGEVLRTVAGADVIALLDEGDEGGASHLVLELADGGSLGDRLRAGLVGDPWQTAQVAASLRGALEVVHAHDLVHRDVQPANLLIRRSGPASSAAALLDRGERLLLADFGIATAASTHARRPPDRGSAHPCTALPSRSPGTAASPARPTSTRPRR